MYNEWENYYDYLGLKPWTLRNTFKTSLDLASEPATSSVSTNLSWDSLQAQLAQCDTCQIHLEQQQITLDSGNRNAKLMIINDAPGSQNATDNFALTTEIDNLLTAMLKAINITRDEIYIAHILKCDSPQHHVTHDDGYHQYLNAQITLVQPRVILAMGEHATQFVTKVNAPLESSRNHIHHYGALKTPVIATYHPAHLLIHTQDKRGAFNDLKAVQKMLHLKFGHL